MYRIERQIQEEGCRIVAGVDEAGRGPLAGPVVAAAVVLDPAHPVDGLADSKTLSAKRRVSLLLEIRSKALAVGVGAAGPREIERRNILRATLRAMATAVCRLGLLLDHVLVDGNQKIPLTVPQTPLVSGDARCASIAAASIVAKVVRDLYMERADGRFPLYGFARHKGYPTRLHLEAIRKHGPCVLHRRSFRGVAAD